MAKIIDLNALAQALDTSWGRSSTPSTATYSVKMRPAGQSSVIVTYSAIVNFGTQGSLIEMKRHHAKEATAAMEASLKSASNAYKEITGTSLKFTATSDPDDMVDVIQSNIYNTKKTAFFKRTMMFEAK